MGPPLLSTYFSGAGFSGRRAGSPQDSIRFSPGKIFCRKVLTDGAICDNIRLALNETAQTNRDARVVELVDSLASGASARKGVRVRLPPRAPKERFERISLFLSSEQKNVTRPPPCSSFPNRTRCAGLRFGFGCRPESLYLERVHASQTSPRNVSVSGVLFFHF